MKLNSFAASGKYVLDCRSSIDIALAKVPYRETVQECSDGSRSAPIGAGNICGGL